MFLNYALVSSSTIGASTEKSSILAGLEAETTTVSIVKISNIEVSILISDNLIELPISFNNDKSTLNASTKLLGNTFTSTSLICSSIIPHSLTA
jgi:hypothetical protein